MNKFVTNGRVIRWLLLLQEFDITILDRHGKDNIIAEFLSKITNDVDVIPAEDVFPYEHFFALSTNIPWLTYISNCLATRKIPTHISLKEWQHIIKKSD
jgi:hypothetical protein